MAGQFPFTNDTVYGGPYTLSQMDTKTSVGVYVVADTNLGIYGIVLLFAAAPHFMIQILFSGTNAKYRRASYSDATFDGSEWIDLN